MSSGRHDLAAAEGQQLGHQIGRAVAGLGDLGDRAAREVFGREVRQRQLAVTVDHLQQVVEVVRDAAGELADGLHLLRLA